MLLFLLLTLFAALPILAYVLAQKTNNKGLIIGFTITVLSLCLIIFISKFALLGSFQKQTLSNKVFDQIYVNSKISSEHLEEIEELLNEAELKNWLIAFIAESINLKKLNSAESLITFSERFFISNEEKFIFYGLYADLRDSKFPEYKESFFEIDNESNFPCLIENGNINIFIMNGPDIPIAKKEFSNIKNIKLINTDSMIPGFDLASALLNKEAIEINIQVTCLDTDDSFYVNNLIAFNPDKKSITYKIILNEWLKTPQEL
tara:strand:+ start:3140 stop:3925 length:786 start_codon:yes stop_codon:yes gene_type:complete